MPCAQSDAHPQLSLSLHGPYQHETRHVGAGHQEQEPDCAHEDEQRRSDVAEDMLFEGPYEHTGSSVRLRKVPCHLPCNTIHVLLGITQASTRPEPGDRLHVAARAVLILARAKGLRSPKICVLRIVEALGEDANHQPGDIVQLDCPTDEVGISTEAALP